MSTNLNEAVPAVKSEPAPADKSDPKKITQEQLEAHSDPKDIWMVISGKGSFFLSCPRSIALFSPTPYTHTHSTLECFPFFFFSFSDMGSLRCH